MTAFVIETFGAMEPDHTKIATYLLFEAVQILRANGNATVIESIPRSMYPPEASTHSDDEARVNTLLFTSLALALSTALFAVMVKQWLEVMLYMFFL